MIAMRLSLGYSNSAAPHGQSGLQSRVQGGRTASNSGFFTFVTAQPSLGGGVGRLRSRRILDSVLQPTFAALLDCSRGGRFNQNRQGVTP